MPPPSSPAWFPMNSTSPDTHTLLPPAPPAASAPSVSPPPPADRALTLEEAGKGGRKHSTSSAPRAALRRGRRHCCPRSERGPRSRCAHPRSLQLGPRCPRSCRPHRATRHSQLPRSRARYASQAALRGILCSHSAVESSSLKIRVVVYKGAVANGHLAVPARNDRTAFPCSLVCLPTHSVTLRKNISRRIARHPWAVSWTVTHREHG
eukprot:2995555-Rhodomonas_salina.1